MYPFSLTLPFPPGCHITLSRVPCALLYCHFDDTGSLPEFSVTSPYSPSTRDVFSVSLAVAWHLCSFSLGPRSGQESGAWVELWSTTQGAHPPPKEEQPKLGVSLPRATTLVPTSHPRTTKPPGHHGHFRSTELVLRGRETSPYPLCFTNKTQMVKEREGPSVRIKALTQIFPGAEEHGSQ